MHLQNPNLSGATDQQIKRDYLVILRAGDRSLHPQWLTEANRNWDLVLSYFGDYPNRYAGQYDFLHLYKGSKWQGIADFLTKTPDAVRGYRYVWLPDDDLLTSGENINNFFSLCDHMGLTIAQPALTPYSYYSWKITLQDQSLAARLTKSAARLTNFVEIMAPCFRAENFDIFSKTFGENTSGWGYEWLWWKLALENNIATFAIVDRTPVYHTRPVGAAGHGGSVKSPSEELRALMQKFNLRKTKVKVIRRVGSRWFG